MFLAAQYYRAPFPHRRRWADDFSQIRDAGMHAVQFWALWGWIESKVGVYRYDDYDELISQAEGKGLKVILSTIAEIHPFWIHRVVPDSRMIDHLGRPVMSCCRGEVNVGLTPGGCFDNPRVAEKMTAFLGNIASRYAGLSSLIGWDCWNETRWAVHADGYVCRCEHTLREFRRWLDERHGGLEGLNAAWQRRYSSWEDVFPFKRPDLPYTDNMEFTRFLAARSAKHMGLRCRTIKAADPGHIVTGHCGTPSILSVGTTEFEPALCRGNDWDLAAQLDGYGTSSFPLWVAKYDEETVGAKIEAIRSADRGKTMWMSELQGGASNMRSGVAIPVPGDLQQRWVAQGMARGGKGTIFWCWRDEVFGRESAGFGIVGWDGQAQARLAAMKKTGQFIDRNQGLLEAYRPDPARVGVFFNADNHLLRWAEAGNAEDSVQGLMGYIVALERLRIPYEVVEAYHMDALLGLDVLFMPRCPVIPAAARKAILSFVRRGGRVLLEAETDAFDELGFYRYPDERPFMQALGLHDLGRRQIGEGSETLTVRLGELAVDMATLVFHTPLTVGRGSQVLARDAAGQALAVRQDVGKGAAYVVGSFLGQAYFRDRTEGLERFVKHVCEDAGSRCDFEVDAGDGNESLLWRSGRSGGKQLLWIINGGGQRQVTVRDLTGRFRRKNSATELVAGQTVTIRPAPHRGCTLTIPAGQYALLSW